MDHLSRFVIKIVLQRIKTVPDKMGRFFGDRDLVKKHLQHGDEQGKRNQGEEDGKDVEKHIQ
jgi:hypothetical protein